jgi:transposase-like protein
MRYTFKEFQAEYPTDEACLDAIMQTQHGGTVLTCPGCRTVEAKFHRMSKRRAYACQHCGHHIYPCAGTIFEKSRTPLTMWFFAMYLMTSTRHGVAAKELERQLGVTYKTAWRMAHELRKLMMSADYQGPLGGHVEIDETFVGGKARGKGTGRGVENKTIVMGMVERKGRIRAGTIPDAGWRTLEPIIIRNIAPGSTISTDEWRGYTGLQVSVYNHGTVKHRAKEYVRGIHHVNTLEGFWGHFKRAVRGTHIHISPKHMNKYVGEFAYRQNMKNSHRNMFTHLAVSFSLPRPVMP